jgi:hypothetical protein
MAKRMSGGHPTPEAFAALSSLFMRGRNVDPDAPFTSSTDKYAGLATMTDIGGFIVVIQMVIGLTDGGEEISSKPLVVVLGPPVVPLQPDSDLGLTEGTMSPSETLWPKERLYPLAFRLIVKV